MNGINHVLFLILKRLRGPLILFIVVYAISILGYVIIPGQDDQGNAYQMSFFDALYIITYMGSTTGFGEIPYTFTYAQRFWTVLALYATVISWFYSIGAVIAIFQDDAFLRVLRRNRFRSSVRSFREPFYIVCGYGLTGSIVVSRLVARGHRCVVVDQSQDRVDALDLDNLPLDVPCICADASQPDTLDDAGIDHPKCIGVLCLTDVDHTNLSIAIASKLLKPKRPVISRTSTKEYARNLESFGTDHIVYPFDIFADYLNMAIHNPYRHLIHDWLTSPKHHDMPMSEKPKKGTWVICGYGRFGKALKQYFDLHDDVATVIIEPNPDHYKHLKASDVIISGLGTEAGTLMEAGIKDAVGIVAGTADDANNLSIIMTAKQLKPTLITVARQNNRFNSQVFKAAKIDMIMDPGFVIANYIMALIKSPLLVSFLKAISQYDELWCEHLLKNMNKLVGKRELDSWSVTIDKETAPAVYHSLVCGKSVPAGIFYQHPLMDKPLACQVLMIRRDKDDILVPDNDYLLRINDEILLSGLDGSSYWVYWILQNDNVLRYILASLNATLTLKQGVAKS